METINRTKFVWALVALTACGCHHASIRGRAPDGSSTPLRLVERQTQSPTVIVAHDHHASEPQRSELTGTDPAAIQLAQHNPLAGPAPIRLASLPIDRQRTTDPRDDLAGSIEMPSQPFETGASPFAVAQPQQPVEDKADQANVSSSARTEGATDATQAGAVTDSPKIQLAQPVQVGVYNLEQLIAIAVANNPAIREAEAAVSKAEGLRYQVGLRPNPLVGYNGTQLADQQTDQHTVFVSQDIVTAQKLQRNTGVLGFEVENLKWQAEIQRRATSGDVKQLFFETLGAQQKLELSKKFVEMAEKAVDISRQRKKAGEGTEVDVLQSEVQLQQIAVANRQQAAALTGAWTRLAAVVGQADMQLGVIDGTLPTETRQYDWEAEYARLCAESPELMAAQTRVARARANLDRQRVQCTPNISWMFAAGYDRGTDSQMINTQVGIPLPVNNQNEGNVTAANADYCRALQEVRRIQLSIKSRLATASQAYQSSAASVDLYKSAVIPKAEKMLELAELTFRAGEIDFLQVLTIRRTYFDSMLEYLNARTELAQANANIEELLISGSLDNATDSSFDDGLRGQSLSGQ